MTSPLSTVQLCLSDHIGCRKASREGGRSKTSAYANICVLYDIQHCDIRGCYICRVSGACEGTLACSTCHLVFSEQNYNKLPQKPTDEELDMLDLAYGLTDT